MSAPAHIDLPACEALARRAAAGDEGACRSLVFDHLWPSWLGLVRGSRFLGRFRGSDDHVENIRTKLAEKIKKTIHSYPAWRQQERNAAKTFADWNRIAVASVIRRYVRARIGDPMEALVEGDPSLKELLNEFTASSALDGLQVTRPPMTLMQTARELMAFAETQLGAVEQSVLALWLSGAGFDEIAAELSLDSAEDAERVQRAAVATLRRAFRSPGEKKQTSA